MPIPERLPERRLEADAPLRIVYTGRLVQGQKRVLDLARIVSGLDEQGIPAELTVIGEGEQRQTLMNACAPFVDRQTVRFLGTLANEQVLAVLGQSDVFVLTSEYEGLPVSLLEAMAWGCVPVVTDIGSGIPELVQDGVNGYRLPVGDIRSFVTRLGSLQEDVVLRSRMSREAYDTICTGGYDLDCMVQRYLELFERVLWVRSPSRS